MERYPKRSESHLFESVFFQWNNQIHCVERSVAGSSYAYPAEESIDGSCCSELLQESLLARKIPIRLDANSTNEMPGSGEARIASSKEANASIAVCSHPIVLVTTGRLPMWTFSVVDNARIGPVGPEQRRGG